MLRSTKVHAYDPSVEKPTFESWKQDVDTIVYNKLQIHCNDLPDEDYWMSWHNNLSAQNMADIVVNNANEMTEYFLELNSN